MGVREIGTVVLNEWMKLLRRRRLWVAGVIALLTVGLFTLVAIQAKHNADSQRPEAQLASAQRALATLRAHPSGDPQYRSTVANLRAEIAALKNEVKSEAPGAPWRDRLRQQAEALRQQMRLVPPAERATSLQYHESQGQLMQTQWELDHNVRPLPGWVPSPYREVTEYLSFAVRLFLPLMVVILVADMVAGEATDGTIKLLLVRPVARWKVLIGKWITSLWASALATVVVVGALWAAGIAVLGNTGAWQPVWVGVHYAWVSGAAAGVNTGGPGGLAPAAGSVAVPLYAHAHLLPAWQYVLASGGLAVLAMLAVATVAFFCSTLFRSAMASTGVSLGLTIVGLVVYELGIREHWVVWLWFPVHLALFDNWNGSVSLQAQMNVPLGFGVAELAAWSAVALAVSLWHFSRRDVLNA
ncbi:MAG: ABC transporter permease subunit [Alicyclobacillaceae bacterium]|nr:ABC transporter permease subunit [Alicyclobacillaceae bacterium]